MMPRVSTTHPSIWRHSPVDGLLVGAAMLHAILLLHWPSIWLIALGLWWNANTVGHNFIHCPFFRSARANRVFALGLCLLQGIPQTLWRDRHLAHHAGRDWHWRGSRRLWTEVGLVAGLWGILIGFWPGFFLSVYVPGYVLGLLLCQLQGHFEHCRGTVSHYGRVYNWLFFNDGYHVEHHAHPGDHWRQLPRRPAAQCVSRWPAVLRWIEGFGLEFLERLVLRSGWLQQVVLAAHGRAFRRLLARLPDIHQVIIVGGGLYPRTALVLRQLLPKAKLTIIDADAVHLECARNWLPAEVEVRHQFFTSSAVEEGVADLVVIPLSFRGDRRRLYVHPPAPHVIVHDWLWHRAGNGSEVVSWCLLKRLNWVTRHAAL